jgi:hypothetical protein
MCSEDGDIPLYLRVGDGNETDSAIFAQLTREFRQQWDIDALFVADAALYTAGNLAQMEQLRWVSRVPATLTSAKQLLLDIEPDAFVASSMPTYKIAPCGNTGVAELGYDKFIVRAPKNNTSKNAELMKCPECQSTHVNKNGQKKGKQNYICVGCGRQFIDCYQPHKGYSEEVKRECLKMYVNGMGFRAIERICMSTSHQHYKLGKASRKIAS